MADDPERDLLPVKDGAPYEDMYTPHISKLDHKTLEDRYLRLLLDNEHLKKESHKQEEKIKRLATKLLRLLAEQKRDIPVTHRRTYNLDCVVMEQQQQIQELQQNNCHLQSKITVLRNQLAEHSSMHSASHCSNKLRSPSRSPARRTGSTSSRAQVGVPSHDSQNLLQAHSNSMCQKPQDSPSSQLCSFHKKNSEAPVDSATIKQNQQLSEEVMRLNEEVRVLEQEMEIQREQNSLRVAELEEELANKVANDERQKISKNVEIIQLQRSLQQQAAQMTANLAKIQVLEREVGRLQQELETSQQENDELQGQLAKERQKLIDNRHDLQKMETDHLSIRELEERVRDLQNEKTALKDHNECLLTLVSSRQKQNSEQETTLRSQVTQLEDMLSNQRCECSRLKQELEEIKELASQNKKSPQREKDLQFQVKELESALVAEKQEKANLMKFLDDMQMKVSEFKIQESQQHSDVENSLRLQITHLEVKLSEVLNERTEIAHNLKEEKEQVEALKISQNDLLQKLQDLQTRHSKIEEQLYIVRQVPKIFEEMTDQVKYTSTWPQGVPPRIPSLEESRSAHKIASAQPEGFNKDSEIYNSFTESSVSTSFVIENKSYAEAESEEGMLKSDVHNISLESESKGSEEAVEKSELSDISRSKESEEAMKKQIIDDIIKSILAKTTTVKENLENKCCDTSFNQQSDENKMASVDEGTLVGTSVGQNMTAESSKRNCINIVSPPTSQISDVELGMDLSSREIKCPVSSTGIDKIGILQNKQNINTSAIKEKVPMIPNENSSYIQEKYKEHSGEIIKVIPSSYYTQLSTLLLASMTKATSKHLIQSPLIFQSVSKASPDSEKLSSEHEDTMDESLRMDISGLEPVNSDEVNSMAAAPDESRTDTANKIDIYRELEKCRELLRVQYNLTSLYKKEVVSLATRLNEKETEENKLNNESSKKQEITQSTNINKLPSHQAPPKSEESQCSHLYIKPGEGVFEIHIQHLELHPESLQNLTSHVDMPSLFLTWYFYNEDVAYTPVKKVEKMIEFDSSSVCRVTLNDDFLDYLIEGKCVIEVHVTVEDASEPVARGNISFIELLEFPQNKIHSAISVVEINKHETVADFGLIHCWFRLSCSLQIINDFIQKRNITDFKNFKNLSENSSGSNQSCHSKMIITTTKTKKSQNSRTTMDSSNDKRESEGNTTKESGSTQSESLKNDSSASGSSTNLIAASVMDTYTADSKRKLIFYESLDGGSSQRKKIGEIDKVKMQLRSSLPRSRRINIKNIA